MLRGNQSVRLLAVVLLLGSQVFSSGAFGCGLLSRILGTCDQRTSSPTLGVSFGISSSASSCRTRPSSCMRGEQPRFQSAINSMERLNSNSIFDSSRYRLRYEARGDRFRFVEVDSRGVRNPIHVDKNTGVVTGYTRFWASVGTIYRYIQQRWGNSARAPQWAKNFLATYRPIFRLRQELMNLNRSYTRWSSSKRRVPSRRTAPLRIQRQRLEAPEAPPRPVPRPESSRFRRSEFPSGRFTSHRPAPRSRSFGRARVTRRASESLFPRETRFENPVVSQPRPAPRAERPRQTIQSASGGFSGFGFNAASGKVCRPGSG